MYASVFIFDITTMQPKVRDMLRFLALRGEDKVITRTGSKDRFTGSLLQPSRWRAMHCSHPEIFTFSEQQHPKLRLANPRGVREDGIKDRLKFAGRT
jgi:hypothetical protein